MILYKFPFGPLETNAIFFACTQTREGAVVDPAVGSTSAILARAEECGVKIVKILLTHSHWDHFGDARLLKEKTGAPLFVHSLDAGNLEQPGSDGIPLFLPIQPVKPDGFLEEGEELRIGELRMKVIHSPGHSRGSVCFYLPEQKILLSGDTLFEGSIGNLRLPTAEPDQMWRSLQKLAQLPPETRVVPGHGGDTEIGKEAWLTRAKEIFS